MLKHLDFKFDYQLKQWYTYGLSPLQKEALHKLGVILPPQYLDAEPALVKLVRTDQGWILNGHTYPMKNIFKSLGFKWDGVRKKWWKPKINKKTWEELDRLGITMPAMAVQEMTRWKQAGLQLQSDTLDEKLKQYPPDCYVSFQGGMRSSQGPLMKIGINPKPVDASTPAGVYAFPITMFQTSDQPPHELSYWSPRKPLVYIIKPKSPNKLFIINNRETRALYSKIVRETDASGNYPTPAKITHQFMQMGYDGIIDQGTSTMHSFESTQAVFFGAQTINVIDVFENPEGPRKQEIKTRRTFGRLGDPLLAQAIKPSEDPFAGFK